MKWEKFTAKTMPPVNSGKYLLICRGYRDPGGGVMCTGKCVQYGDEEAHVKYLGWSKEDGFDWMILEQSEYKTCLWQEIEYPC
jgi:hypothetical protein